MKHLINAMLRLGRIRLVDDSGAVQRVQIDEGSLGAFGGNRIIDRVASIMHFGFASSPPLDAEAMLVAPGGDRTQSIAIGTNHQASRPRILKTGDSTLYDVRGAMVWLSAGGIIIDGVGLPVTVRNTPTVTITASQSITLDAPNVECTGNFKADKLLTGDGAPVELGALRDAYNAHRHTGVSVGSGTSGAPDRTV